MISVIIPTLWKSTTTKNLLSDLICVDKIDEIIIINNDSANTPDWKILDDRKITIIDRNQNIYVNPSWNLGVKISKNNSICLLNDDILFDNSIFNLVDDDILSSVGLIGIDIYNNGGTPRIEQIQEWPFAFGCMMFVHKNKYRPIPEALKVMWGDTYLLINLQKFGLYVIRGSKVSQTISVTTSNPEVINKYNLNQIYAEENYWWTTNQDKIYEDI
jgi:hypothetical protein